MVQSVDNMALGRFSKCWRSGLLEPSKILLFGGFQSGWIERCAGARRYLLTEDVLRLRDFQQRKLVLAQHEAGSTENYIALFKEKLQNKKLILRNELKLLLHFCESADDMVIAKEAIYRYHAENRNSAFGEYKFGPIFMRLCYELGLEEMAMATLTDENMRGFFNDTTSFNIAMDMLFTKHCHENILEVLQTMRRHGLPFNKDTLILATASCYKLNTPESYRTCMSLIEEGQSKGYFIPRRAFCFAVALALQQNDLANAQSLYSQIMNTDSRLCQNLKITLIIMSGAITDALNILSQATLAQGPSLVRKPEFSQELVDLLRLQSESGPQMKRLEHIVSQLEQGSQVIQQSLDDMLCYTPTQKRKPTFLMKQRKISRRTLSPIQSSLLLE